MKSQSIFVCSKCDNQFPRWQGRCTECGAWSSITEKVADTPTKPKLQYNTSDIEILDFAKISTDQVPRISTNISELDNVFGGGIVAGSVILLGGDPGIGKSTMCLQILSEIASHASKPVLYVSGEESASQVKLRADRLGIHITNSKMFAQTNLEKIIYAISQTQPSLVIIDSIQTLSSDENPSEPGNISQIKIATSKLVEIAKKTNVPIIITGHVTKDGNIAGPKALEHLVDVVLWLEGDRNTAHRVLRSTKNRFGSTHEIGVFEMTLTGLQQIKNPELFFLEKNTPQIPGTCITAVCAGNKIFFAEIQALVNKTQFGMPTRKSSGFDLNRLSLLCAVISKRLRIPLSSQDVYLNVVGGFSSKDPGMDLAVCYSLISAFRNQNTLAGAVTFGEVGLGGEVRAVIDMERRTKDAIKLSFKHVLCSATTPFGKGVIAVNHISQLLSHLQGENEVTKTAVFNASFE